MDDAPGERQSPIHTSDYLCDVMEYSTMINNSFSLVTTEKCVVKTIITVLSKAQKKSKQTLTELH